MEGEDITVDAYVVVFSVTDPSTYNYAVNTVRKLRVESGTDRAIILAVSYTHLTLPTLAVV